MTKATNLCMPWSLHFDRDGTEDYGIIIDADGNDLVASHLPSSTVARLADRPFGTGCFWLPEEEWHEMPLLVRQMQAMKAAPKLLEMLKIAIATADPHKHKWVKEAQAAIAEATGQPFDKKEAKATWHLHRAGHRMFEALKVCEEMLKHYKWLAETIATRLAETNGTLPDRIEKARREAFAALCEAGLEIAF